MPTRKRIRHAEIVSRFAERLRELRRSSGMTQLELARRAHITEAYCGRLERGEAAPGIDLVDRLASALGTTAADLLPTAATPDTLAVLRGQAKNLFDEILRSADRETFLMLNPLLARLAETSARGH